LISLSNFVRGSSFKFIAMLCSFGKCLLLTGLGDVANSIYYNKKIGV